MTALPFTQPLFKIFKMKNICLFLLGLICFSYSTIAQIVPQGYLVGPTGMIGGQLWAAKNLNTGSFANGDAIPYYTSAIAFAGLTSPASCSVNFNANNDAIYGRLYNWYAIIDSRNVCPVGWHVPSTTEFTTLNTYIGGNGNALKETGTTHWTMGGGTDIYDFTAVGTGYMGTTSYSNLNKVTHFWTTNSVSTTGATAWNLQDGSASFSAASQGKIGGFTVRCIHD